MNFLGLPVPKPVTGKEREADISFKGSKSVGSKSPPRPVPRVLMA